MLSEGVFITHRQKSDGYNLNPRPHRPSQIHQKIIRVAAGGEVELLHAFQPQIEAEFVHFVGEPIETAYPAQARFGRIVGRFANLRGVVQ